MLPLLGMLLLLLLQQAKRAKSLEVQVDAAGVVAAVAVVATTTPDCLEVDVQDGCDVEAEAKMGTAKPGGKSR